MGNLAMVACVSRFGTALKWRFFLSSAKAATLRQIKGPCTSNTLSHLLSMPKIICYRKSEKSEPRPHVLPLHFHAVSSFNTAKRCTLHIILCNLYLYFKCILYKNSNTLHNPFKVDILLYYT
jgi:hypothetical protein